VHEDDWPDKVLEEAAFCPFWRARGRDELSLSAKTIRTYRTQVLGRVG